ncbi:MULTISPECIES: hypothetical protein [Pseudomonas]|uniref:Uncharacterized protein n=1 Tax=Pseudomonas eucalypticola TaxID=2599595 RepID=A0A7D5HDZ1_9PSED|nr:MULTISPECIES: hypothetical protein [Pseudomonas]QKZ05090.1 hypothetical protein HWQ56_15345 [Pseudomonas eucalypticola]
MLRLVAYALLFLISFGIAVDHRREYRRGQARRRARVASQHTHAQD